MKEEESLGLLRLFRKGMMSRDIINSVQIKCTEEQRQKLAAAYALILSWLEPSKVESTRSEINKEDAMSVTKTSTDNAITS